MPEQKTPQAPQPQTKSVEVKPGIFRSTSSSSIFTTKK